VALGSLGAESLTLNSRRPCMAGRTQQQSGIPRSPADTASGSGAADSTALERACSRILYWLDAEQLEKVRAAASIERIRAHSIIGPDDNNLRYLLTGAVRTSYTDQGCRRRLSNFLGPGDMVQNPFFCSPGTFRVFEAITDSSVLKIPVEPFADAVAGVPWTSFNRSVTAILGTTFSLLALNTRLRGVRAISRLAQVLLDLGSKFGVEDSGGTVLTIKVTNTDLAALVGCSRQQLTMLMNELIKRRVIFRRASRMVLNTSKLTTLANLGRVGIVNLANAPLSRCFQIMENAPRPNR
jgi:CRP/FNR family transcriptional regulator, cyclic AMP receptor protein